MKVMAAEALLEKMIVEVRERIKAEKGRMKEAAGGSENEGQ